MSQAGYTPIQLYYSTTAAAVPTNTNLANGELAINITDGKLYYKDNTGTVKLLAGATAGPAGGSNTQVQFNSSGVLAGSANMTFDGTILTAAGFSGPLNGTVGATTPTTGAFTTLTTSSTVTHNGGTANGVTYLNGSKVLTSGSALVFDGTNFTAPRTQVTTVGSPPAAGAGIELIGSTSPLILAYNRGTSAYISLNTTASAMQWNIGASAAMSLDTSGNLGIGTSLPSARLTTSVAGNFSVAHDNYSGDGLSIVCTASNASDGGYAAGISFSDINGGVRHAGIAPVQTGSDNNQIGLAFFSKSTTSSTSDLAERLRIASTGAFGLSGANYGTSGQVLTSGGSGAAPTWTTVGGGSSQWVTSGSDIYYNTGNVAVGSAPQTYSLGKALEVGFAGNGINGASQTQVTFIGNAYYNGGWKYGGTGKAAFMQIDAGAILWYNTDTSGTAGASISTFSERMRITSAGNVGIGTSSPGAKLDVAGDTRIRGDSSNATFTSAGNLAIKRSTNDPVFSLHQDDGARIGYFQVQANGVATLSIGVAQALAFQTNNTEAMRITSSGSLLVGTTAQLATNLLHTVTKQQLPNSNSTAWADQMSPLVVYGNFGDGTNDQGVSSALTVVGWSSLAGNNGSIMRGWWSQNGAGLSTPTLKIQIAHTGNVTNLNNSYGSLSDVRLKENITDATPKLENLNKLRVVNFNLKDDPEKIKQIGLIAQEVENVFPALVETDGEGTKSVKYSVLVPMLVKAMQEQQAIIESLKARLDAANL